MDGVTESQLPPEMVEAAAVKLSDPPAPVTETDCGAGIDPPVTYENESEGGVAGKPAATETLRMRPPLEM